MISPHGLERGSTKTFNLEGRNLNAVRTVLFDTPGISAKVADIVDISEKITGPRINVDLAAQVPLGKKQTAKMEVTGCQGCQAWAALVSHPDGSWHFESRTYGDQRSA